MRKMNDTEVMEKIEELAKENDCEILLITKVGSQLFGTHHENSDVDYGGVFLPSKKSCVLGTALKKIKFSTGEDGKKNSKDDIDISLWSLQRWLNLINKGDTNAIDVLYSITNKECTLVYDTRLSLLFSLREKLFNKKDLKGYIGYVRSQSLKYGMKGTKFNIIKNAYEWIMTLDQSLDNDHLWSVNYQDLLDKHGDDQYLYKEDVEEKPSIVLCGKVHNLETRIGEVKKRFDKEFRKKYGKRAQEAAKNNGVDYKAISHSVRAIHQMKQILLDGDIKFPLETADFIREVKLGEHSFESVEALLDDGLNEIYNIIDNNPPKDTKDLDFIDYFVLLMYKEAKGAYL